MSFEEIKENFCQKEVQGNQNIVADELSDEKILQRFDSLLQRLFGEGTGWNMQLLCRGMNLYMKSKSAEEQLISADETVPDEEQSREDHAAAHQAALATVEQCTRAADSLYEISCRMMEFRQIYQELTSSLRGEFHELNELYKGDYLEPGLKQLCLLERDISGVSQNQYASYAQKLRYILEEQFGCQQIIPAVGEMFDGRQMEMEIVDSKARQAPIQKLVVVGWKRGTEVLCKAIVSMKEEEV